MPSQIPATLSERRGAGRDDGADVLFVVVAAARPLVLAPENLGGRGWAARQPRDRPPVIAGAGDRHRLDDGGPAADDPPVLELHRLGGGRVSASRGEWTGRPAV